MKVLKIIGVILVVLLIALLAMGLFGAKDYRVERSTVIDASGAAIFPHLQFFEKRDAWSPWSKMDPDMEQSVTGQDGAVGATHQWKGDEATVGEGSETVTAIKMNERVDSRLDFKSPQESTSNAYVYLTDADQGTKVTWGFEGQTSFMERIVFTFMNLEDMIGPQFEAGMASLKEIVEKEKASKKSFAIQEVDFPGQEFIYNRQVVSMDKIKSFYEDNLGKMYGTCQAKKIEMTGMPCGLYFTWDEEKKESDMAAAIPVKKAVDLGNDMKAYSIPSGKALLIDYYGSYEGIGDAHEAMDAYIKEKGLTGKVPAMEQYVTDPTTEPDQAKWLTKIYYFLG